MFSKTISVIMDVSCYKCEWSNFILDVVLHDVHGVTKSWRTRLTYALIRLVQALHNVRAYRNTYSGCEQLSQRLQKYSREALLQLQFRGRAQSFSLRLGKFLTRVLPRAKLV